MCETKPDMDKALADMRELSELARARSFDLFMYLRELTDLGAPVFRAYVNDVAAVSALDCVVHYKLDNGLLALLAALRAMDIHANEIECRSGEGRALPGPAKSPA